MLLGLLAVLLGASTLRSNKAIMDPPFGCLCCEAEAGASRNEGDQEALFAVCFFFDLGCEAFRNLHLVAGLKTTCACVCCACAIQRHEHRVA